MTTVPSPTSPSHAETRTAGAAVPSDVRPEPRESLARAQRWIGELVAAVTPEQLSWPTPCTEMDVSRLVGHLYGVAGRTEVMGHGHPAASAPAFVDDLPDDLAAGYRERTTRAQAAWTDDVSLTRTVVAPFGPMPGADVLGVYLSETSPTAGTWPGPRGSRPRPVPTWSRRRDGRSAPSCHPSPGAGRSRSARSWRQPRRTVP